MSRFSGKCDFCDEIEIFGLERILQSEIYRGNEKLNLNNLNDCKPYYPHIVSSAYWNGVSGRGVIRLSEKSWVDMEEERYGPMKIHEYYRDALAKEMEVIDA